MSDNFVINGTTVTTGSINTRWINKAGIYTPVCVLDIGGAGSESLVSLANGLPIINATGTTIAISASALPLPTGASTSALQPAINVDGGALAHVTNFPVSYTVTGTVAVNTITGFATETTLGTVATNTNKFAFTGANLNVVFSNTSINVGAVTTLPNVTLNSQTGGFAQESGGNLANIYTKLNSSIAVTGAFYQATQPVSAASLPLPTGAATEATLGLINTKLAATLAVTQSGTWNIGSITTLPSLVAGAAVVGKVGIDQTTPGTTNAVYLSGKAATPTLRSNVGSILSVTAANAVTASAYAVAADKLTIDNTTNNALLVDFSITPTFGTAPTSGALQLIAVDWSLAATPVAGSAPTALLLGKVVGTFSPQPAASNAATSFVCRLDNVALSPKTDYYIYNGTNQTLNTGWALSAQCWTVGN